MAGNKIKIGTKTVEAAERVPETGTALWWDAALSGFGLRVTANGVRSYIVQGRIGRKTRRITIGRHGAPATLVGPDGKKTTGDLTPDRARKQALHLLGQMAGGTDPVEDKRREEVASLTLREAVEDYIQNKRRKSDGKPLADRTKADIRRHLDKSFAAWADKPVSTITADGVARLYKKLSDRSQAQGNQAMRVLSAILNYVVRRHQGAVIASNPANVIHDAGHYRGNVAPRKTKVPDDKIGIFYNAIDEARLAGNPGQRIKATAAYLLMLTGLRKADLLERRWADVDMNAGTLHVADTKHRSPRAFPLATQALAALRDLESLTGGGDYIFRANTPRGYCSEIRSGLAPGIEATGVHIAAHDLRRTWITAVKETGVDPLAAELLANRKGAQVQALAVRFESYDNDDLSHYRPQAQALADWFEEQGRIAAADNVIAMEARA